jgi:hypothetical protein
MDFVDDRFDPDPSGSEIIKKWFLGLTPEKKIEVLKKTYEEHGFGDYKALAQIGLDDESGKNTLHADALQEAFETWDHTK